jgi:hypothetical protein
MTLFSQHPALSGRLRRVGLLVLAALLLAIVSASSSVGTATATTATPAMSADDGGQSIVGAWLVNAVGAPFQPHVMEFHADGTFEIDNPESGDPHTSDSVGMGPYKLMGDGRVVRGSFWEVNADRNSHAYVSLLIVKFTVQLSADGKTFSGPATANYYNPSTNSNPIGTHQQGPFPATLEGTRITLSAGD